MLNSLLSEVIQHSKDFITHLNGEVFPIGRLIIQKHECREMVASESFWLISSFYSVYTAGGYLKTHDFLQPLERVGKNAMTMKEDVEAGMTAVDRPPVPAPPASVEHLLPGGIGTYSISYFNQRGLKPEGSLFTAQPISCTTRNDENSNCSSYTGGGFTLWDESAVKKGKTGKENIAAERHILRGIFSYIFPSYHPKLEMLI